MLEDAVRLITAERVEDQNTKALEEACENILNGLFRKMEIGREIKRLRRRMRGTNFFYHLVRNNPRHRDQYYFALIAIVGYEKWADIHADIRMNWESARLSFDRMYGMVKNFALHLHTYTAVLDGQKVPEKKIPMTWLN